MNKSFRVPNETAIIFVAPEYAVLSKNYAFKTMAQPIFTNSNSLNSFLKFRLPKPMYATVTGNKAHYVHIHDSGSMIADMRLEFSDANYNDKVGVYELPISNSSAYSKPINTQTTLSQFLRNNGKGIYFIFACRTDPCPRGIIRTVQMTGGGSTNVPVRNVPPEGQTRFTGLPSNIRRALPTINKRGNQGKRPGAENLPPAVRNAAKNLTTRKKENAAKEAKARAKKAATAKRLAFANLMKRKRAKAAKEAKAAKAKKAVTDKRLAPKRPVAKRTATKTKRYIAARRASRRKAVANVSNEISRLLKTPPTKARLNKLYIQLAKLKNIEGTSEVLQ